MTQMSRSVVGRRLRGLRDEAVARSAPLTDTRPVAVLAHLGIEYEQLVRSLVALPPQVVRTTWGLAGRDDLARVTERLSALEDRLRVLETDTAGKRARA